MRYHMMTAAAALLALAGCQGGAQQTGVDLAQNAGAGIIRNLSAADLAKLKDACMAAAPALIAATGQTAPVTVKDVAVYPYAFCEQIISGSAGNADQTSLSWLPTVLGYVKSAAGIAGYVLPLLPLLL